MVLWNRLHNVSTTRVDPERLEETTGRHSSPGGTQFRTIVIGGRV
jgi:hypothetical protein